MCQQLLDRDCQCSVEGGEVVPKHLLFAEPKAVNDLDAMSSIQSYQCIRGIGVCSRRQIALQAGELNGLILRVKRYPVSWKFELPTDHVRT